MMFTKKTASPFGRCSSKNTMLYLKPPNLGQAINSFEIRSVYFVLFIGKREYQSRFQVQNCKFLK